MLDRSEWNLTHCCLAKRIKYRDLFKQVPLDSNKIQDFLTDGGKEDLEKLLSQYCDGNDPKYYYWHNVSKFEMFESEEEKCGYFVKDGVATRFTESDHFMPHTLHVREGKRYTLFAVREAIDDIVKMIS